MGSSRIEDRLYTGAASALVLEAFAVNDRRLRLQWQGTDSQEAHEAIERSLHRSGVRFPTEMMAAYVAAVVSGTDFVA